MILFYLLGKAIGGKVEWNIEHALIALALLSVYGCSSLLNWVYDQDIDKANNRKNPISHLKLTKSDNWVIVFVFLFIAFNSLLFTTFSIVNNIAIIILFLLGFVYSYPRIHYSYHPVGKILIMTLNYACIPLLLGLFPNWSILNLSLIIALSIYCASWLLYTDIKDIKGDRLYGKKTAAVVLGTPRLAIISGLLTLVSVSYISFLLPADGLIFNTTIIFFVGGIILQLIFVNKHSLLNNLTILRGAGYLLIMEVLLLIVLYELKI